MMENNEFTISFWIRVDKNPGWRIKSSDINFPPFDVNGVRINFAKHGSVFEILILHPNFKPQRIEAQVEKFLDKDAFITLTKSNDGVRLYINAEDVSGV